MEYTKTRLLVEIETTLASGGRYVGTGYQVADDRILTAAHVVFGPDDDSYNSHSSLIVKWRGEDESTVVDSQEVDKQSGVVWSSWDEDTDLALIGITPREGSVPPIGKLLGLSCPRPGAVWSGAGYAGRQRDIKHSRQMTIPEGRIPLAERQNPPWLALNSTDGARMDERDDWGGCSGGPVFVDGSLYGLLCAASAKSRGSGLLVMLIAHALDRVDDRGGNLTLAEALGLPENLLRVHAWGAVSEKIVALLRANHKFEKDLCEISGQEDGTATETLVNALNSLQNSDSRVIEWIARLFGREDYKNDVELLSPLHQLVMLWLMFWGGGRGDIVTAKRSADQGDGVVHLTVSDKAYGYLEVDGFMAALHGDRDPCFILVNDNQLRPALDMTPIAQGLDDEGEDRTREAVNDWAGNVIPGVLEAKRRMKEVYEEQEGMSAEGIADEDLGFFISEHFETQMLMYPKKYPGQPYICGKAGEDWTLFKKWFPIFSIVSVDIKDDDRSARALVRKLEQLALAMEKRLAELNKKSS